MNTLIKQTFILVILNFLISCGQQTNQDISINKKELSNPNTLNDSIVGERINGPANIRDKVNGEVIFSLNDSALVTCTEQQNGWYAVGLTMQIPNGEFDSNTLRKGRKIVVDGKVVGEVLKDMYVSTSTNTKESWAELAGYTHKDNIYPSTIIENALTNHIAKVNDRSVEALRPFIKSFQMEENKELKQFITYFNYESWIDDPSPLLRIQLVFQGNKLVGVTHSRPLKLPNTTDYKLNRDFRVAFFNDTPQETKDSFIKQFNQFINSVD